MARQGIAARCWLLIAGSLALAAAGACGGSDGGEPTAPPFFGTGTPPSSGAFATAAPGDPTVFGTIALDFTPYGEGAVMPEPPYGLTLLIRPAGDDTNTISHEVAEDGTFELTVTAGDYEIVGLGIDAPSLQDFPFIHATAGPTFTAPEGGCSFVGLMRYSIYRLPPVESGDQLVITGEIAEEVGKDVKLTTVVLGGLVQYDETVEAGAPSSDASDCARDPAEFTES